MSLSGLQSLVGIHQIGILKQINYNIYSDGTKNSLNTPMQSDLTLVIDRKKLKPLFIIFSFSDTLHVWKMMPFRQETLLLFLTLGVFALKGGSSQGITGRFFLFLLYSNKK